MPDPPTWGEVLPDTPDHGYINTATVGHLMSAWEKIWTERHGTEQNQG